MGINGKLLSIESKLEENIPILRNSIIQKDGIIPFNQEEKYELKLHTFTTEFDAKSMAKGAFYFLIGEKGKIFRSVTSDQWDPCESNTTSCLNDLVYNSTTGLHIIVGYNGTILTSPDGITWTSQISNTNNVLRGISYVSGLGLYIIYGDNGTILTSPDGIIWTRQKPECKDHLYDFGVGGGFYILVGSN